MNKQAIITENSMEYLVSYDKNGVEKKRYCLETNPAVWVPTHPGDICPEYMLRYCRAQGIADLEWYVSILETKITKEEKNKTTGEVIKTVQRKRTPSEVKKEFIDRYFKDKVKKVKDEEYQGHASKAKKLLEEMRSQQPSPKKSSTKE